MSIPDRLWRVVKGYWEIAEDRVTSGAQSLAQADAYRELAEALRGHPAPEERPAATESATVRPTATVSSTVLPQTPPAPPSGHFDPLQASYDLLGVQPGADLPALTLAYESRLSLIHPERYPEGSAERVTLQAKADAVRAAYEKVRDSLNPTETRFERLEF